jgi:hypothetical protein
MTKASDYYFMVIDGEDEEDDSYLGIVSKEFWSVNECLDDTSIHSELKNILPKGFTETMESMFEYYKPSDSYEPPDIEKGKEILLELGFEEIDNPF